MKGIICNGLNLAAVAWLAVLPVDAQSPRNNSPAANQSAPIPMDQLGAVAGKQYQGDGLSVTATPDGARLRCAFQRLEGAVTRDGLWLRSTAGGTQGERFRVMAVAAGRTADFAPAGDFPIDFVAADGRVWSALGLTLNNTVSVLAVSGTNLYAGGAFTYATNGGPVAVNVNRIAKWDGGEWSALGSGMNNTVRALATSGTDLYAGGDFIRAGGKVSGYTARANIGAAASPGMFSNLVYSPNTGFTCTFCDGTIGQPYRIQSSSSLAVGPWTELTNFIYASPIVITDASAVSATNTFYRAVTP